MSWVKRSVLPDSHKPTRQMPRLLTRPLFHKKRKIPVKNSPYGKALTTDSSFGLSLLNNKESKVKVVQSASTIHRYTLI